MDRNSKRAAMEMSVGTMVTIVLLMIVLVLGIFFIQKIFKSGSNAIDTIDSQVQSEIQKLFAQEGRSLAVYPTSREVVLVKGDDPKGFAFSVKNQEAEASYSFTVIATDVSNCGSGFSATTANSYLIGGTGSFNLGAGKSLDLPKLVKFDIPDSSPVCTIVYTLDIKRLGVSSSTADVFVTIK